MKVLVTSGGTKVPIDMVRSITNMSKGTFGAKIATELLRLGHSVHFLCAKGSCTPMSRKFDFVRSGQSFDQSGEFAHVGNNFQKALRELMDLAEFYDKYKDQYEETSFKTFDQYAGLLEWACVGGNWAPDVVILACAASDYGVENPVSGKIRSREDQEIKLSAYPKLISKIKKWCPNARLIGFKLLVNSTDEELCAAAWKSIEENGCDLVVANDLRDIEAGDHRLLLVGRDWSAPDKLKIVIHQEKENPNPEDRNYLARFVADIATKVNLLDTGWCV